MDRLASASGSEHEAPAAGEADARFMRRALALAMRGWGQTAPNPMVGAVVVSDGEIVAEGFHAGYGAEHAEAVALAAAGARARGATLYATLEPCTHQGKRPPCAPAIVDAGITRVVIATRDPNPVAAGGAAFLRSAGIEVVTGIVEQEARELNAPFFNRFVSDRPWLTLKLAVSLDGAIADASRSSGWLTGPASRREVHRQRAVADAIAIGIGTALNDDPKLTVRGVRRPRVAPARVVFDRAARIPLESRLVTTIGDARLVIVTDGSAPEREIALERAGATIVRAPGTVDALRALKMMGIDSLYAEGGAGLAGALLDAEVVDRLIIFRAPVILGAGAVSGFGEARSFAVDQAPRFRLLRQRRFGDDDMTIYALR
jgi:diaminohydroxyphosphoribosylaminopyrimidine deaminase/5-amino-6-(5-phosphoribosylamino)uracil reductase